MADVATSPSSSEVRKVPNTNILEFVERLRRGELPTQVVGIGDADKYAHLDQTMPHLVPPPIDHPVPFVPALPPKSANRQVAEGSSGLQRTPRVEPPVNSVAVYAPAPQAGGAQTVSAAPMGGASVPLQQQPSTPHAGGAPLGGAFPSGAQPHAGAAGGAAESPASPNAPQIQALKARYKQLTEQGQTLQRERDDALMGADDDIGGAVDDARIAALDTRIRSVQQQQQSVGQELRELRRANPLGAPANFPAAAPAAAGGSTAATAHANAAFPPPAAPAASNTFGAATGPPGFQEGGAQITNFSKSSGPSLIQAAAGLGGGGGAGGGMSGGMSGGFGGGGDGGFGGGGAYGGASAGQYPGAPNRRGFQWEGVVGAMSRDAAGAAVQVEVNNTAEWDRESFPWSAAMRQMLRQRFGLNSFRPCQLPVINATMSGRDVLVLLPTGGGKSLCYQLPAILGNGSALTVTIVFSPLVSLIQDQVQQLQAIGIKALALTGTTPESDRRALYDEWRTLAISTYLVYVTPEFYGRSDHFVNQLQSLNANNRLGRIVIDEAHCLSQWGHDFRPDYRKLEHLKRLLRSVPILALTATATDGVQRDILNTLGMPRACLFHASFNRPNLAYFTKRVGKKAEDATVEILRRPDLQGKCGIVYCLSKKDCETMSHALTRAGIKSAFYHSEANSKDVVQAQWSGDKIRVMCATIAFGMGINKPDVRFVVHASLPKSIEGYYQESGRAGRDGLPSECHLLWSGSDKQFHDRMAHGKPPSDQVHRIQEYALDDVTCRRNQQLAHFGEVSNAPICSTSDENMLCDNCQSRRDDGWIDHVFDATVEAADLCKWIIHIGYMTAKQLVGVYRGTASAMGKTVEARYKAKGKPRDLSDRKPPSNEIAERIVLHLLLKGVLKENLKEIGGGRNSTVVGYVEMGNANLYQRLLRKEETIGFKQRKAAPKSRTAAPASAAAAAESVASPTTANAPSVPGTGNVGVARPVQRTAAGVKKQQQQRAMEEAMRFYEEDAEVAQQVFEASRRPSAAVPETPLESMVPVAKTVLGPFRVPPGRAGATNIDSQEGVIPTPANPGAVCLTVGNFPTPADPAPAQGNTEMLSMVAAERFRRSLFDLRAKVAAENGLRPHNILPETTIKALTEKMHVPQWGSDPAHLANIEGLSNHRIAEYGTWILGLFRLIRAKGLGDVPATLSPAEEATLKGWEVSHRPQLQYDPVRPQLIDDEESPGRRSGFGGGPGSGNQPKPPGAVSGAAVVSDSQSQLDMSVQIVEPLMPAPAGAAAPPQRQPPAFVQHAFTGANDGQRPLTPTPQGPPQNVPSPTSIFDNPTTKPKRTLFRPGGGRAPAQPAAEPPAHHPPQHQHQHQQQQHAAAPVAAAAAQQSAQSSFMAMQNQYQYQPPQQPPQAQPAAPPASMPAAAPCATMQTAPEHSLFPAPRQQQHRPLVPVDGGDGSAIPAPQQETTTQAPKPKSLSDLMDKDAWDLLDLCDDAQKNTPFRPRASAVTVGSGSSAGRPDGGSSPSTRGSILLLPTVSTHQSNAQRPDGEAHLTAPVAQFTNAAGHGQRPDSAEAPAARQATYYSLASDGDDDDDATL